MAARAVALPRRWLVVGRRDGAEVLRAWTAEVADRLDVSPAPDLEGPGVDGDVELQDTARWMVDFDEAERCGMAVRIPAAEVAGGLEPGCRPAPRHRSRLGSSPRSTPPGASAGCSRTTRTPTACPRSRRAPRPTSPLRGGPASHPPTSGSSWRWTPNAVPSADAVTGSAADRLYRALGLPLAPGDVLRAVPGADGRPQEAEGRLADVLWESTLGSFLSDVLRPVVPGQPRTGCFGTTCASTCSREGRSPRCACRGSPTASSRSSPATSSPTRPNRWRRTCSTSWSKLRIFWEQAVPRVPRLGRTPDLDADLDELLQTTPLAAAVRFRTVLGPLTVSSTVGLDRHAVAQQYISSMLGVHLGLPPPTPWNEFALHPGHQHFDRPLVGDATAGRLADIAELVRTSGSFERLKAREEEVATLLEAMALYAAERELHRADMATINGFRVTSGQLDATAGARRPAAGTSTSGSRPPTTVPAGSVRVTTPAEASRVVIPGVTGQQTVRAFVTDRLAEADPPAEVATVQRVLSRPRRPELLPARGARPGPARPARRVQPPARRLVHLAGHAAARRRPRHDSRRRPPRRRTAGSTTCDRPPTPRSTTASSMLPRWPRRPPPPCCAAATWPTTTPSTRPWRSTSPRNGSGPPSPCSTASRRASRWRRCSATGSNGRCATRE